MNLDDKSKESLSAAKVLIDNSLHNSSIHCSYYSCFQKISSILIDFYTREILDSEIRAAGKQGGGKHVQYTTKFTSILIAFIKNSAYQITQRTITDFTEKITMLKSLRVQADYYENDMNSQKSNKAYDLANDILNIIKLIQP